jgi:hypothetical protein
LSSRRGTVSETAAERAAAVQQAGAAVQQLVVATANEPEDVKKAALDVVAGIPSPQGADVGWLWRALVVGLLILILVAAGGVIWAVMDGNAKTDADKLLIIFTPALSGLIGIFVPSPTTRT